MMRHHVMALFYDTKYGDDTLSQVALFDNRDITKPEVSRLIRAEQYDPRVTVITRHQYDRVFRSLSGRTKSPAPKKEGTNHGAS